jgi:hypothetical protein
LVHFITFRVTRHKNALKRQLRIPADVGDNTKKTESYGYRF